MNENSTMIEQQKAHIKIQDTCSIILISHDSNSPITDTSG